MPNFETHDAIGIAAGAGYAVYRTRGQAPILRFVEAVAGGLGGSVGGRLPDLLEPATWPGHRDVAHSAACAGLIMKSRSPVEKWSAQMESTISQLLFSPSPSDVQLGPSTEQFVTAICMALVVGFVNGLLAGYLSHLALDGCTPSGIPLLMTRNQ
jgi:membrane-bound metal-dependent hydrolase YbcI (DUF457 family)